MTDTKHRIYISKTNENLDLTLRNGLEFIEWDKYINKNSTVFVKPNFTFLRYVEGVTTNPVLLRCFLKILKNKAKRVIVGESDGGNHSFKAEEAFHGHGMYEICEATDAELVNLSTLPSETVESKILGKNIKVQLPRMLLEEIDCFISMPVLKVHVMTTVTLSLKNSWGCVPDTMRGMHHQNLSSKLALIAQCIKPKIVVMDGTYALNNHGPMYGDPMKMDLLVVADNTVAADALCARLMGFSPQKIQHIADAEKAGLGSAKLEDVTTNQNWERYRMQFNIRRTLIDRASFLPFNNDMLAKLIFQSPLRPIIYKVVHILRTSREKELAGQMGK